MHHENEHKSFNAMVAAEFRQALVKKRRFDTTSLS